MKTINFTDTIYASARQGANVLASIRLSGITSQADALRYLRHQMPYSNGMVMVTVRNSTAGWSDTRAMLFSL